MSPVFDAGKPLVPGAMGWGCSCPANRGGEPTPEQAMQALAKSANVTVVDEGAFRDGSHHFKAWTEPGTEPYEVTYGPGRPGWCKHAIACLSHYAPWFRQLALGAGEILAENHQLRKENRKLERQNERLRK